jgi:hypothetical protein
VRRTRKAVFLDEMNQFVPWSELVALIAPHAPRAKTGRQRWPHSFEQIPKIFKWILRGQAAWAEGRGSESKYTTSGVRACRLECGLRVL